MEMKRLQNAPLRDGRLVAVWNSMDALAERFVDGAPTRRFEIKKRELEGEFRSFSDALSFVKIAADTHPEKSKSRTSKL